jgi:hypothetical protein
MIRATPTLPEQEAVNDQSRDVLGLYDAVDGVPTFVVADLTTDDRWVSIPTDDTVSLDEWR